MEGLDQDTAILRSFCRVQSMNTHIGSDPQLESDSNQETSDSNNSSNNTQSTMEFIEFRTVHLKNRCLVLQKKQHFRKNAEENRGSVTEEIPCEDNDEEDVCELETIQKELEQLQVKKEELEKQKKKQIFTVNEGQQSESPTFCKRWTPRGGIYILPTPQQTQEDIALEQRTQTPLGPPIPVEHLGRKSAVTLCPSCDTVVQTTTRHTVGHAMWLVCCVCSSLGCIAGCCLIPFCTERMKNVKHQCPQCQAHIHTDKPI